MRVQDLHKRYFCVCCSSLVGDHAVVFSSVKVHRRLDQEVWLGLPVEAKIVMVPLEGARVGGGASHAHTEGELLAVDHLQGLRVGSDVRLL